MANTNVGLILIKGFVSLPSPETIPMASEPRRSSLANPDGTVSIPLSSIRDNINAPTPLPPSTSSRRLVPPALHETDPAAASGPFNTSNPSALVSKSRKTDAVTEIAPANVLPTPPSSSPTPVPSEEEQAANILLLLKPTVATPPWPAATPHTTPETTSNPNVDREAQKWLTRPRVGDKNSTALSETLLYNIDDIVLTAEYLLRFAQDVMSSSNLLHLDDKPDDRLEEDEDGDSPDISDRAVDTYSICHGKSLHISAIPGNAIHAIQRFRRIHILNGSTSDSRHGELESNRCSLLSLPPYIRYIREVSKKTNNWEAGVASYERAPTEPLSSEAVDNSSNKTEGAATYNDKAYTIRPQQNLKLPQLARGKAILASLYSKNFTPSQLKRHRAAKARLRFLPRSSTPQLGPEILDDDTITCIPAPKPLAEEVTKSITSEIIPSIETEAPCTTRLSLRVPKHPHHPQLNKDKLEVKDQKETEHRGQDEEDTELKGQNGRMCKHALGMDPKDTPSVKASPRIAGNCELRYDANWGHKARFLDREIYYRKPYKDDHERRDMDWPVIKAHQNYFADDLKLRLEKKRLSTLRPSKEDTPCSKGKKRKASSSSTDTPAPKTPRIHKTLDIHRPDRSISIELATMLITEAKPDHLDHDKCRAQTNLMSGLERKTRSTRETREWERGGVGSWELKS